MMFPVDSFEAAQSKVRIDLRGGDVRVAEEGLDGAEIGSAFDHVGGAAVAEHVRAGRLLTAFDQMPDPGTAEGQPAGGEEEAAGRFLLECGAAVLQIAFERFDGGAAERD